MMRPRNYGPVIALVLLSLFALHDNSLSHPDAVSLSSSTVTIHLVGNVNGWNGTNPTITVNHGDTVSIILTSIDLEHQFALDRDKDGAMGTGSCPTGDECSKVFNAGTGTTFTFTANLAPGNYTYFCTFHFAMVGRLAVRATPNPPTLTITSVSPNPAFTGTPVTLNYTVTSSTTVTGISVDWGDGTITHPGPTAKSDTHSYLTTSAKSQAFTINVTATSSAGHSSATASETVKDRPPTLTITNVSPNPAKTGETVTINFTASDPDGTLSSLTISWGDGSAPATLPASARSDTHSYSTTGSFTITVTATDNSGSSTHVSSSPFTVTAPSGPGDHHHHHHHHHHDNDHRGDDSTAQRDDEADTARDSEPESPIE